MQSSHMKLASLFFILAGLFFIAAGTLPAVFGGRSVDLTFSTLGTALTTIGSVFAVSTPSSEDERQQA